MSNFLYFWNFIGLKFKLIFNINKLANKYYSTTFRFRLLKI